MTSNKNFEFDGHSPRVTSALYKRICKNMAQGLVCAMLGFCAIVLPAQASAEQVALRDFFERRQFINMKLSPDARHIAFSYEQGNEVRLAVMTAADRKVVNHFSFGDAMHVQEFIWATNQRLVMAVGKVTGYLDSDGRPTNLYASDINGDNRREIFEMASSRYALLHRLPKDPAHILIAKYHWADNGKGKVHRLNIENGRLDYTADEPSGDIRGLGADTEGRVRIAVETLEGKSEDDERTFLHVRGVGESKWTKLDLTAKRKRVAFQPVGFSADGQRAYFLSNFDQEKQDRLGLFEYDFQSKKVDLVHREADVDLAGPLLGANGEVLGVFHLGGRGEQLLMDDRVKHGQFINMLVQAFKGQHVSVTSYSDDGNQAIVRVRSDRNPGEFYLFDLDTRKATFLEASLPKIKAKQMLETEPVVIAANDGMRLHALLTRPASKAKQLPLIINVHGGPFGVTDFWGFHPESQFFASRGYAVLQVNYRGSGNRGSDFERAGYRQWGTRMQQDLVDATEWAIKEGIADPKRVCIYGGSYGGYAALWGVIKDPDLYRCAVGIVGVYDLVQFRKGDGSDFNRFGGDYFEKFMKARVGEDPEALRAVSPVHHVDKIKAELFIIHGEKDVRVPVEHAYRLRDALKKVNKNFEWMIKPEGHGFYDVNNRVDMYTQVLAFFEKHIGKAQ
ncbi:MAG: hypothetical protein RL585_740 [Pseudomonadota bacterium]|jgi:dipeptidyl aminopeptidase/acylaminoacyl peptidase|nr:S9 family peptidase [Betaproteobacteria bacterium]